MRLGELEATLELGRRKAPVLTGDDAAERRRGEEKLEVLRAILGENGDARAVPDAAIREHAGETVDAIRERSVGERAARVIDGDVMWVLARSSAKETVDRARRGT
jgi:hypothetical protein